MAFDFKKALTAPDGNRAEWRAYICRKGEDAAYYVGNSIESMNYSRSVESEEKKTIAQYQPTVSNKDGGLTIPVSFKLTPGDKAYDMIVQSGLTGSVNDEFVALLVYGNMRVVQEGAVVPDACFAHRSAAKLTVSEMGGEGTEVVTITGEIKSDGTIDNGYVTLDEEGTNYDPEKETWKLAAFTSVASFAPGEVFYGKPEDYVAA